MEKGLQLILDARLSLASNLELLSKVILHDIFARTNFFPLPLCFQVYREIFCLILPGYHPIRQSDSEDKDTFA